MSAASAMVDAGQRNFLLLENEAAESILGAVYALKTLRNGIANEMVEFRDCTSYRNVAGGHVGVLMIVPLHGVQVRTIGKVLELPKSHRIPRKSIVRVRFFVARDPTVAGPELEDCEISAFCSCMSTFTILPLSPVIC